jgi:hypothetical protein
MDINVGKISLVVDLVAMVQTIEAAQRETRLTSSRTVRTETRP